MRPLLTLIVVPLVGFVACGETSKSTESAGDAGSSRGGSAHSPATHGGQGASGGEEAHSGGDDHGEEGHAGEGGAHTGNEHGAGGAHEGPSASDAGAGGETHTGHGNTGGAGAELTFYEDVAPILNQHCVSCHQPGSIAPFSLVDYESAEPYAHAMAHAVLERHMPPMPVDNSGLCNTYSNARWLRDAEIRTIADWAAQGAAEGDPAHAPELPQAPTDLGSADVTLDTGVEYRPSTEINDDYRCFVLPSPITSRSFVTAYQVLPGEPAVVHHVILYQPTSEQLAQSARDLDAKDDSPGYECFGGPGVLSDPVALWAPGSSVIEMPAGTGIALEPGRDLILQVHYNVAAGSLPDRTRVQLELASDVTPARFMPVANVRLALVPDLAYQETEAAQNRVIDNPLVVYGAAPHMHTRGKTMEVAFTPQNTERCMVSVDRWHFHWQNLWWYQTPVELDSLQRVRIRCGYDTRGLYQPVLWGEGTQDEMCIAYFYVTGLD